MTYKNKFKETFFNINRKHLTDKSVKSRFINPSLNESQLKFRNYLLSRTQMMKDKKNTFFVSLSTRDSKRCDYPFTNEKSITSIVSEWNDPYFDLSYEYDHTTERQALRVAVNPVYFDDFANASLRVEITSVNTKSFSIFARELKNIFISSNEENYIYLNDFCGEANKFNTTSITCLKMRHQTFKHALKKALNSCKTVDSESIRWCRKTYRFFYKLTTATTTFKEMVKNIQKLGSEHVVGIKNLLNSIRNTPKNEKTNEQHSFAQKEAKDALNSINNNKVNEKTNDKILSDEEFEDFILNFEF
ncbi:hypothetical protein [Vibrio splendidus]|uniref:hypothetical protein n=1 Tax=Vibrio splendidus TaxID=29497 RepID=UPI00076A3199|nr:hypothetical protein [Vibrio splendidus]PHX05455.1 hypothetical protein VSPL_32380 [Vibrio splendidus]